MDADPPPDKLPEERDWEKDIMCGIHAHPSMNHLHIHVMSVDRHSDSLKHRKHYNSFSTPFFIDVMDFPLAKDDPRRHPGRAGYLNRDYKCWRCGENFGNRFTRLKDHLETEYQAWRRVQQVAHELIFQFIIEIPRRLKRCSKTEQHYLFNNKTTGTFSNDLVAATRLKEAISPYIYSRR